MDPVLTWLSDNRDVLIAGVVLLVLGALGKWGTAILRRWRERQRLAKDQKKERPSREEERQQRLAKERQQLAKEREEERQQLAKEREEERQHCLQQFDSCAAANWVGLPPETDVGKVIVGYLSDYLWRGCPYWKFRGESVSGDVVDLKFAVKATVFGREIVRKPEDEGNELGPAERAAQVFHSGAEVTLGPFVDDDTVFGDGLFGYVSVCIRVSKVPD